MAKHGASATAVAFTREIGGTGYMTGIRNTGNLSIASVLEPFRANENELLFLISPNAKPLDVDGVPKLLETARLRQDRAFQEVLMKYPNVLIWPADRSNVDDILAFQTSGGGQQFVVPYLLSTCHACKRLGKTFFRFSFDVNGRFLSVDYCGMLATGNVKVKQFLVTMEAGETRTLLLQGNPSTGYSWFSDLDKSKGKQNEDRVIGAPREEEFLLQAPKSGERLIHFSYSRPWDEQQQPAKRIEVIVRIS